MTLSIGLLIFAAIICWLGMAFLALSQPRNWRTLGLSGKAGSHARLFGWVLLVLSLGPIWLRDGLNFAILIWPMFIATSAISIAMLLAHRPRILRWLAKPIQREG